MTESIGRRLYVCSDFLERVHSDICHICLQPKGAHPTDNDVQYWAQWLISEMSLETMEA